MFPEFSKVMVFVYFLICKTFLLNSHTLTEESHMNLPILIFL